jgi:ribonuclease HI
VTGTPASSGAKAFGVRDLAEFDSRFAELRAQGDVPAEAGAFVAHTDGACLGNPEGPGGWAAVVEAASHPGPWLLWGHLSSTSNNRAEALGVLAALRWVPAGSSLSIFSDSNLTVNILEGRFKAKANPDVWEVIRRTIREQTLRVSATWLRGHAGDPRNELADRLSKMGAANRREAPDLATLDLSSAGGLVTTTTPTGPERELLPELVGVEPRGDWEKEFVRSVARQLRARRTLSPKQQAVIDRIRSRGATAAQDGTDQPA